MGLLVEMNGTRRITLGRRFLVGRANHCQLQLEANCVSGEHASIRWRDGAWYVRDLGSRNGTRVDDAVVASGDEVSLREGCELNFGSRSVGWRLEDVSPPLAKAIAERSGRVAEASQGLLALPSADSPECVLFLDGSGRWTAEGDAMHQPVADGDLVELSDDTWRLLIPARSDELPTTRAAEEAPRLVSSITVAIRVSRDQEFISVSLNDGSWSADLGARAFNELLLLLARAREEDARSDLGAADQGWVYADDLCKMVDVDRPLLDLHVHRARQQAGAAGVENPGQLIERRPSTRQLRLGTHRVAILES